MSLQTTWFLLIAVLWTGFFVLEGFDFGVGMLTPLLGRTPEERGELKETTGPFWDGNEVWLITAGGATFAAFPPWYATMFSAYYLPLFLVLVGLALRATGLEYRDRRDAAGWKARWDWLIAGSCLAVPLLIGVALGGLLGGIPIDDQQEFTGSFVDLVQPFALVTGVLFALLCAFQGLVFLRLKVEEPLAGRATAMARRVGPLLVAVLVVHLVWMQAETGHGVVPGLAAWLALTFAVAALWLVHEEGHTGAAFVCSTLAIASTVANLFTELYPNTMVSSTSSTLNLTISDSSGSYTLTLMTVVAVVMVPVVLLYTAWSYWVFRGRVRRAGIGAPARAPGSRQA